MLKNTFIFDLTKDFRDSVLIAGVSRSGTTWFSNLINYKNVYRDIFEPFHPKHVSLFSDFSDRQYIREFSTDEVYINKIGKVLCGKLHTEWSDQFNKRLISKKRLVKATRANLFLKWIYNKFPEIPIVLIMRHPCAVASSKIRFNKKVDDNRWATELTKYIEQKDLVDDFLSPFLKEIEDANNRYLKTGDIFENTVFGWCIENYVPLKQFSGREINVVFYEEICTMPNHILPETFAHIGLDYNTDVIQSIRDASKTSLSDSAIENNENLIETWRNNLDQNQITRAVDILGLFGLNELYSDASMPNPSALESFGLFRNSSMSKI